MNLQSCIMDILILCWCNFNDYLLGEHLTRHIFFRAPLKQDKSEITVVKMPAFEYTNRSIRCLRFTTNLKDSCSLVAPTTVVMSRGVSRFFFNFQP